MATISELGVSADTSEIVRLSIETIYRTDYNLQLQFKSIKLSRI